MTVQQEHELLRRALLKAAALDFRAEAPEPSISPRQAKRMHAMLEDPFGYAKRMRRPLWRKIAHTAAMAAVTIGLSVAVLTAVSPTVRAAIKAWFMEIRNSDIVYYFAGESKDEELPYYTITELPEGYAPTGEMVELPDYRLMVFENSAHQQLTLEYSAMTDGGRFWVSTSDMQVRDITVNGHPGQLFLSLDETQSSAVLWMDEEANLQFLIDSFADESALLHIAESVSLCKTERP